MPSIEERLSGGHPNSLGNTIEVVEDVLAHPEIFDELFQCYFSKDEVVRLRVSNAMKRIEKENHALLLPYIDRFLGEIAAIDQASTQWTIAQLFDRLEKDMNAQQIQRAKAIMKHNLEHHNDWIVLNHTMQTLAGWSAKDPSLGKWLVPHLERLSNDSRKSVAKRAVKLLKQLS